jgi:pilus assembly protein Flp/PilA
MLEYLKTWMKLEGDRRGVTMLEYGLIAALIAVVCISAVTALGGSLNTMFNTVANHVSNATSAG